MRTRSDTSWRFVPTKRGRSSCLSTGTTGSRNRLLEAISALVICAVFAGCSSAGTCWLSPKEAETYPILYLPPDAPTSSPFRVQGIYRGGFELSNLAVGYEGEVSDIPKLTPFDYCLSVARNCEREFDTLTRSEPPFSGRFDYFGQIDGIVHYEGKSTDLDCPMGELRLVHLVRQKN